VHTLALFASAVLVLMLDSFLFSLITGTQVPDDGDRRGICAIAWTQGSVSTGMLAAGATALFGGLGWMLASHAVNKAADQDPEDIRAYCFLADLGGWLTFAAAMTTTLILSETSIDYLFFMFGRRPELWVQGIITTSAAAVVLVDFVLVYVRTKALRRSLTNTAEPTRLALRSIKVATVCTVVLAIIASWLAVSLNRFPADWLTAPSTAGVVFVLILTFVVPIIVSTAICYSVPSTDERGPWPRLARYRSAST
jgi:ABC-type xylose transport system permease subunit